MSCRNENTKPQRHAMIFRNESGQSCSRFAVRGVVVAYLKTLCNASHRDAATVSITSMSRSKTQRERKS